jgi:hypothetical protein
MENDIVLWEGGSENSKRVVLHPAQNLSWGVGHLSLAGFDACHAKRLIGIGHLPVYPPTKYYKADTRAAPGRLLRGQPLPRRADTQQPLVSAPARGV